MTLEEMVAQSEALVGARATSALDLTKGRRRAVQKFSQHKDVWVSSTPTTTIGRTRPAMWHGLLRGE